MDYLLLLQTDTIFRLCLAVALGALIGLERTIAGKQAGMRTYAMVSLGSAVFVLISEYSRLQFGMFAGFDPLRMATQVVVGIGFIGAGLIIFQGNNIHGLTTAAGLWVTAGLGMAVGFGYYFLALSSSLLTVFIFSLLWRFEHFLSPATVPDVHPAEK